MRSWSATRSTRRPDFCATSASSKNNVGGCLPGKRDLKLVYKVRARSKRLRISALSNARIQDTFADVIHKWGSKRGPLLQIFLLFVVLIKFIQLLQFVLFEVIDVGDILVLDKPLVPKNDTGVVVFHEAHEDDQDQDKHDRKPKHSWCGAAQIFLDVHDDRYA